MEQKTALITGILGQDGPYLAKFLLEKNYKIYGLIKRYSNPNFSNTDYLGITDKIDYLQGDMTDECSLMNIIKSIRPEEVYNLAAQSFVAASWDQAKLTTETNALGVLYLLNALKFFSPATKFYQASTSEMFGNSSNNGLQDEETPFHPRSPYAISKLSAHWITNNFKESYGMFCCNGILFNHESPLRGKEFVTRKITMWIAKYYSGRLPKGDKLHLGNIDTYRDFGHSADYVRAMYLMLQSDTPDNYVVSTGVSHSIRDFAAAAFRQIGILDYMKYIQIDQSLFRPSEVEYLCGRYNKIYQKLGWAPQYMFEDIVKEMVKEDIKRINK